MDKAGITPSLVRCLLADQFPRWADLAVTAVDLDGWDNTTFRLGGDMSVRLPSAEAYAAQVDKEQRWLPVLGEHLPLAIPRPLALGVPGCGYRWPWSVYRWREGRPATVERIADLTDFAETLAEFLTALYSIDSTGGPPPGWHNSFRGGPLATYDAETRETIRRLGDEIDARAATEVWEAAVAASWSGLAVWVHGDVAPSNLLVVDGRLSSVVDFGCSAVGDPACDTVIAWTFLSGPSRDAFRTGLALDEGTWARGRGWALWKALITQRRSSPDSHDGERRFGWRGTAVSVIEEVLADHWASGSAA